MSMIIVQQYFSLAVVYSPMFVYSDTKPQASGQFQGHDYKEVIIYMQ